MNKRRQRPHPQSPRTAAAGTPSPHRAVGKGAPPNIIGAIIGYMLGVLLGFILIICVINVAAWSWLALVPALLPPPFDLLTQTLLALHIFNAFALIVVSVVIIALVFAAYWIASTGIVFPVPRGLVTATGAERFGRGALVGFNAGMNNAILLTLLAAVPGGIVVAFVLTLIGVAACVLAVSNNAIYQVVLAYGSIFMPMSAPMNLVGALCLMLNTAAMAFGVSLRDGLNKSILDFSDHSKRKAWFSLCSLTQRLAAVESGRYIPVSEEPLSFSEVPLALSSTGGAPISSCTAVSAPPSIWRTSLSRTPR